MPPVAVAAAGVAVMAVGTGLSHINQRKQLKQQKKAMRFERQKNELQSSRQRLEAVRAMRNSYATAQQTAENQGVADSSAAQGGQGSIVSQGLANLSFLDQYGFLSDQAGQALEKAMSYGGKASMWSSVAQVGAQVYSAAGGIPMGGGNKGAVGPAPPSAEQLGDDFWANFNMTIPLRGGRERGWYVGR